MYCRYRFVVLLACLMMSSCHSVPPWQAAGAPALMNMSDYFPTRIISSSQPRPLKRTPAALISSYSFDGQQFTLDQFIQRTRATGLIILRSGGIAHESYHLGADANTKFTSWSVAKSVTATLLGFARQDGHIHSFDDLLINYLPELETTAYKDVTIRQALQMSSGVTFNEDYDRSSDFGEFMQHWATQGSANAYLLTRQEKAAPPGTVFNYNTSETQVLGWLLQRTTGQSVADYLTEKIWRPAGMATDAYWLLDTKQGMEITGIGLNATLQDFARFGLMYASQEHLPAGWVAEATRPSEPHLANGALYDGISLGYQYQWWSFPDGSFEAQGIFGQFIYVNPKKQLVVVLTSAWPKAWVMEYEREFYALLAALNQLP